MNKNEILKNLDDDEKYYGDYGKQFLSNSDIKALLNDPLNFKKPIVGNPNLIKGGYFHTLVLEPEKLERYKIIDASTRNTKIYKDLSGGEMCLLQKEADELQLLRDKLMANNVCRELIQDIDVEYEVPGIIQLEDEWWKLKADIVNNTQGFVVDLKTTSDLDKFRYSAKLYNYDSQAYIYSSYFKKDMIFVVVDKQTHKIGIFDCSPEFLERGKEKVQRAVEQYRLFYKDQDFDPAQYIITKTL
ncbi:MAG: PD-(D/E)XK nuclease-like domain-containing protein [Polaribacter sp.]